MNFNKGLPNSDIRKALAELRTKKLIILSGTLFQNNFGELRTIMRLLLLANDEGMVFLNPLTLDNVTYRRVDGIRKNMDHFLHIQNGAILLNPFSVRTSGNHERGGPAQTLESLPRPPKFSKLKSVVVEAIPNPRSIAEATPNPREASRPLI